MDPPRKPKPGPEPKPKKIREGAGNRLHPGATAGTPETQAVTELEVGKVEEETTITESHGTVIKVTDHHRVEGRANPAEVPTTVENETTITATERSGDLTDHPGGTQGGVLMMSQTIVIATRT